MSKEAIDRLRAAAQNEQTCIALQALLTATEADRDRLAAEVDALRKDAERYRWLRDDKSNHLHLTRNAEHAVNYMTAAQWIEESEDWFADNSEEELQAMKDANTIWCLHVYPDTPIGSYVWNAATLDAAIDAAMEKP